MDALTGEDPIPLNWIWTLNQNEGSILILAVLLVISAILVLFFSGSVPAFRVYLPMFSSPDGQNTISQATQEDVRGSISSKKSNPTSMPFPGPSEGAAGNVSAMSSPEPSEGAAGNVSAMSSPGPSEGAAGNVFAVSSPGPSEGAAGNASAMSSPGPSEGAAGNVFAVSSPGPSEGAAGNVFAVSSPGPSEGAAGNVSAMSSPEPSEGAAGNVSAMSSPGPSEGAAGNVSTMSAPGQTKAAAENVAGIRFSNKKSDTNLGILPDSLQLKAVLQFLSVLSNTFFASITFILGLGLLLMTGFSLAWVLVLDFAGVYLLLFMLRLFSSYLALKQPAFVLQFCLPFVRISASMSGFITSYYSRIIRAAIHKHQTPQAITMDELSEAIENQEEKNEGEAKILRSIVEFGEVEVKEVMKSRGDVVAVDVSNTFKQLLEEIIESGYSRMPVIDQSFDQVAGILYIKDILPFLQEGDDFRWQQLIRKPYFTIESKLLSDLLEEFRFQKNHMAIVVDEYGGTSGIITLEDILEEIVGEITDEMDEAEVTFSQTGPSSYLFEGKTLLNDFLRMMGEESDYFDDYKGDTESLAGLILEKTGVIPEKGCEISIREYFFRIKLVDSRRIKQIEVNVNKAT